MNDRLKREDSHSNHETTKFNHKSVFIKLITKYDYYLITTLLSFFFQKRNSQCTACPNIISNRKIIFAFLFEFSFAEDSENRDCLFDDYI